MTTNTELVPAVTLSAEPTGMPAFYSKNENFQETAEYALTPDAMQTAQILEAYFTSVVEQTPNATLDEIQVLMCKRLQQKKNSSQYHKLFRKALVLQEQFWTKTTKWHMCVKESLDKLNSTDIESVVFDLVPREPGETNALKVLLPAWLLHLQFPNLTAVTYGAHFMLSASVIVGTMGRRLILHFTNLQNNNVLLDLLKTAVEKALVEQFVIVSTFRDKSK